ncbi:TatD family hydrolase [Aliarcobacter butzleri]|uniref:TatD family hydrolase n=1 Tax=Aliarcobacter butzleri TaxID=28197 RepID=UPI0034181FB1
MSKIPKNRILVETDAPFIKNVLPYNNYFVYDYLSEYWDISIIDVYKIIYKNFNTFCNNKAITQQTLL